MKNKICFIMLFCSLFFCTGSFAQPAEDTPARQIIEVEVAGNKNVSGAAILSKIKTREGRPFSQVVASDDLKRLYALGYFTDIKIDLQDEPAGVRVVFNVKEKPVLREISIAGNKSIRTKKLEELVQSQVGEFLNLHRLQQDMRDIQKSYEAKGFPLASIDYEMDLDEETNEAGIRIDIKEQSRVKIKEIYIEGNQAFSDKKILKLMRIRKDSLFTSGMYKKEVLELDLERIRQFYQQNGFLDIKVSFDKSFGAEQKKLYITIQIEEGKQYLVGAISVTGTAVFPEEEIRKRINLKTGDAFDKEAVKYDLSNVQTFYFEKGYITAEVSVDSILNEKTGRIDIIYRIVENELAYIDKIRVRGNTKTRDMVIRRELRCYPGEPFDGKKLTRSKERLYNLGYFQELSYETEATDSPNKRDLIVNVKEAKTGEFAFGAGFSSVERFIGFVEIAQRNFDITNWHTFTGAGQDLRAKAEFGTNRREYDISFTEPWIFGYPLSFGVDGYNKTWDKSGQTGYSYDEERSGGAVRLGKEFTDYLRGDLVYRLENVDISNLPDEASQGLKDEAGENTVSSVFLGLTQDMRDNVYNPSRGFVLGCSGQVAGGPLGQDKDFYKIRGNFNFYKTLWEKLLWELKVVAGGADTYDDTDILPIYERFFAGGTNTIRGFKQRAVGPRDSSGEPIGGESALYGTCELTHPLVQFIKVALFCDFGNVWEKLGDFASGDFKYSVGAGVRVKTPIGPVKLDYGYPLKVDEGEEKEGRFHFSMMRGF